MLKLGTSVQSIVSKGGVAKICLNPNYTSDFSVNGDGWTGDTGIGVIIGNRDAIGGLNDNLGVRFAVGIPIITRTLAAEVSSGCTYTYSLRVFVPTGNKDVTYISKLLIGGEQIIQSQLEPLQPIPGLYLLELLLHQKP
jgi:hypothetical protein